MRQETSNLIATIIMLLIGFAIGTFYGFHEGAGWVREKCETVHNFRYKPTNTIYWCATEKQLLEVQK